MTKKMFMAVACLGAAIGFGSSMASAQSLALRVNLPYATKVGDVSLPAGKYSIHTIKSFGSSTVLEISSDEHKGLSTFALAHQVTAPSLDPANSSKVVLREEDNGSYQIQKIWVEGDDVGFELNSAE